MRYVKHPVVAVYQVHFEIGVFGVLLLQFLKTVAAV